MKFPFSITKAVITILFIQSVQLFGNSVFELPTPKTFVNDYAGILSETHLQQLEQKVIAYDLETSTQIAIVTVKSLEGLESSVFAFRLADQWGVGQKDKDNGILILVKPKYLYEKGEVYIAVGYGMEHIVPDAKAKLIVENILIPSFKKRNYYRGLDKAVDSIIELASGEYKNTKRQRFHIPDSTLIIIAIGASLILLPVIYLIYIGKRKVAKEFDHFYIKGSYNSENLIKQVELMEKKSGKNYPKFKKLIVKYERISRKNFQKYSDKIDRQMFCYLLNGQKRKRLFWEMADPLLKFMFLYIITILLVICGFLFNNIGIFAALIGLGVSFLVFYGLFGFLISFIEMYQFLLRKNAKYVGGVSVALFALNALFKRNIRRKYNAQTGSYTYYPHVIYYSGGSGGSGGYGGFSGGFSGGGFGGGSFGGGGAGGSW